MSEVKPCPFCGAPGESDAEGYTVCTNDDCLTGSAAVSVAVWNTRPVEDALRAALANARQGLPAPGNACVILSKDEYAGQIALLAEAAKGAKP